MISLLNRLGCAGALVLSATSAHAALTISGGVTKNVSCVSGVCTATAATTVLNKNDLETMLASSNVQVVPGSVAMDIVTEAGVTWASGYTLTLDAYRNLTVNWPISVNGTGAFTILTNDGGSGGDYTFGPKGKVTFLSTSNALTINGTAFTLLGSMSDVQAINANLTGNFALANFLNASGVKNWIPLGTDGMGSVLNLEGFTGTFEGLGHTINNLTVNLGKYDYAGLFGYSYGTIRDVGIVGGAVTGNKYVGGLSASNSGTILHSYSTDAVEGTFNQSSVTGGLVGINEGAIIRCYAAGTVAGTSQTGGLAGQNYYVGTISESFATGTVTATGAYSDDSNPSAGGLVGYQHYDSPTIEYSYATGAVPGTAGYRGGLGGGIEKGAVNESYSTGAINDSGLAVAGFIGLANSITTSDDYWDVTTSGMTKGCNNGANGACTTVYGLTTAQFQAGLPTGFDPTIWAENPSINNGFPYLINNPPPQ
jgi:GLUG motif-containing protein